MQIADKRLPRNIENLPAAAGLTSRPVLPGSSPGDRPGGGAVQLRSSQHCRWLGRMPFRITPRYLLVITLLLVSTTMAACSSTSPTTTGGSTEEWQEEFNLSGRSLDHTGESKYFILVPGFQLVLESTNETLVITVLDETRQIGEITTRVVEEREHKNGELYEISRNFFAIDPATGDMFYFGEEVDFYVLGKIVGHSGAWVAYEGENLPGLIMPGSPEVGMKYYQEIAPGVAMDRARVVSTTETFTTVAGEFTDCLLTQESSKLNPAAIEYKTYCPGIGLVQDQSLLLTGYGFAIQP